MANNSFAQKINDARLMSAGIRAHSEELAGVSLTAAAADSIDAMAQEMQQMDTEQEKLKSQLKELTEQLNTKAADLVKQMNDAKKRVKLALNQAKWKEFGISDKK